MSEFYLRVETDETPDAVLAAMDDVPASIWLVAGDEITVTLTREEALAAIGEYIPVPETGRIPTYIEYARSLDRKIRAALGEPSGKEVDLVADGLFVDAARQAMADEEER